MYLFQICWATQQSSHVPPGICTSALQRTRLWIIDLHDWFKTIFAGFFSTNYIKKRCISVIMYRWWWLCRNKVLSSSLRWQKCPQWCHWCGYFSMKSPGRQPFSACTLSLCMPYLQRPGCWLQGDCTGMHIHPALCQRQHGCASATTAPQICTKSLFCPSL